MYGSLGLGMTGTGSEAIQVFMGLGLLGTGFEGKLMVIHLHLTQIGGFRRRVRIRNPTLLGAPRKER